MSELSTNVPPIARDCVHDDGLLIDGARVPPTLGLPVRPDLG